MSKYTSSLHTRRELFRRNRILVVLQLSGGNDGLNTVEDWLGAKSEPILGRKFEKLALL